MSSQSFKQEAYAQDTDVVFIALLTLSGDGLEEPIRVASDPFENLTEFGPDVYGVVSNSETFIYLPFDIILPQDNSTGVISAKLVIDNVDRSIIPHARSVTVPLDVKVQCVLSKDVDFVEFEFNHFKLTNVTYDAFSIEGDLDMNYWGLEPFPSGTFTPAQFPGLF